MSTYNSINWDELIGLPDLAQLAIAIRTLKNQSTVSSVRPYEDAGVITKSEHNAMHSSRANSDISFPHSFLVTPVHKIPNDFESEIVAHVWGGFAWDFALRNLLPDNVEGIIVEIKNSCNQSGLYELIGYDAFYLGENATKESKYTRMEVARDLSLNTHPDFTATPGHCRYTVVSIQIVGSIVLLQLQLTFVTFHQKAYTPEYYIS